VTDDAYDLACLVPVYNESKTIQTLLARLSESLQGTSISSQVIVIDDGSTDDTVAKIQALERSNIQLLQRDRNGGKAAAVRDGLELANSHWVVIQDGDLEYDPSDIPRLMGATDSTSVAVYGRRPSLWHRPSRWPLTAGVLGIDVLIWSVYGSFVRDHASCYKLIPTMTLRRMGLQSEGFATCAEMTCKLMRMGCSIRQIPIAYCPRSKSEGKKLRWKDGILAGLEVWRQRRWQPGTEAGAPISKNRENPIAERRAFTLVELLVVIGIVGVLFAIALPAIQAAREAARRTQCQNRLKQIGLAVFGFESAFKVVPTNGGPADGNFILATDNSLVKPSTTSFVSGGMNTWGVGSSGYEPSDQTGPWTYSILPRLELAPLHVDNVFAPSIAAYRCPSRSRSDALPPQPDRYGHYEGGGHAMAKTDYAANHLAIENRPDVLKLRQISDGLTQTLLVGEKAFDPFVQTETSWHWDEPVWIGGSMGTARDGTVIVPDGPGISYERNWGSSHVSTVNLLYFDGRVSPFSISGDSEVLAAILTVDGNETVESP